MTDATQREPNTEDAPATAYTVVTQAKTFRVVYFTDDPGYTPPMDGDWYYASTYRGALPDGMSVRNCSNWRFNGAIFIAAYSPQPASELEVLLEHNRRALMRILHEKINITRAPYAASCALGETSRRNKLIEANAWLAQPQSRPAYPFLEAVAVARNLSMADAAQLVCKRAEQTDQILLATERVREKFTVLIQQATTEEALLQIRVWLLDDVYPELTRQFTFPVETNEPAKLDEPIPETHRRHEITRLQAQLREKINQQRAKFGSQYLQNDSALMLKAQLAQTLLSNQGKAPTNVDFSVLENYAQARGLPLNEAAELLLNALAATGQNLIDSEKTKDRMLAKIDALRTLGDVAKLAFEIEGP